MSRLRKRRLPRLPVRGCNTPTSGATDLGEYELTSGATVRVFLFDEKPYMHLPGVGDVQMFPTGRDTFTVRVVQGVGIAFERGTDDTVTTVTLTLGEHTLTASSARPH